MERVLNPEEKIRRAEEIYYRRKMMLDNRNYARVNVSENKKEFSFLKKFVLQILICVVIYSIFYMVKNTDFIFSENVINKAREILSYDININKLYNETKQYLDALVRKYDNGNENEDSNVESENEENSEEIVINNDEGIETKTSEKQQDVILSQMEQDAKDILDNKSLIIPLKGTITSRFGTRESDNPIVTKNHTGIDIAVNAGTVFIASMSGTVKEVSSQRRFRKSYKNCK